ncbi:MAG: hypothetical protein WA849_14320 [Candidatus Udaeobacter sp.]
MITALAVDTLLVSVLAWMSIQASVTLAAILTVILLPWALVRVRRSPTLAATTLAMLAMLWRREAWKTVFLQSEQQVLELQRRQQPRVSSNTEWSNPGLSTLHVAECFGPRFALVRFRSGVPLTGPRTLQYQSVQRDSIVLLTSSDNTLVMYQAEGSIVCLAQYQPWFSQTGLDRRRAQNDQIRAVNNFNNQSDPTPLDFM